jgi:eukaryotic-like serine/threonine-protein kinase
MTAPPRPRLGKYEILQTLGSGAMGVVYLAYDAVIERKVAVKTIRKEILGQEASSEVAARFRREAMAAGRLTHPGIVAVYDYGEDESVAYIVMEYAPGQDLGRYAASRNLSLSEVGGLMTQLLDALGFAHAAGVVHRDVKPGNILVGERLKITDFGIARVADSSLTQTGVAMGTPAYMAPELYMGIAIDYRVDLFAAGVVLYELLTKTLPFDGNSLEELSYKICHTEPTLATLVRPDLPRGVDAVLAKALAKSSAARFASAADLSHAIAQALNGVELEPARESHLSHAGGPPSSQVHVVAWSLETQRALEAALAPTMGSVAGAAVRRGMARATDSEQLVRLLLETVEGDSARSTLADQLRGVLGAGRPASASVPPSSTLEGVSVSPEAVARVTQTLATYVGPIAKVMVKKASADSPSYLDLCLRVSARLETEDEKTRFLKEVGVR